jgi:L-fuculose-phosphate aldolase
MGHSRQLLAKELRYAAAVLDQMGCLPATDGNFSSRLDDTTVLITASGVEKRVLNEESFVEVLLNENPPTGISSEWPLHRSLYLNRSDINCVLHVHAPCLTSFAVAHRIPDVGLLAETTAEVGEIVLVPFVHPGTSELGDALITTSRTASIYLLANHGAVAVGSSIQEAMHRLERAEHLAKVEIQAASLGGGIRLKDAQIQKLQRQS